MARATMRFRKVTSHTYRQNITEGSCTMHEREHYTDSHAPFLAQCFTALCCTGSLTISSFGAGICERHG